MIEEDVNDVPGSQPVSGEQQETSQQPQGDSTTIDSQAGLKRKLPSDFTAPGKENIAPNMSHRRRPAEDNGLSKRATNLAEVRESLSFLIDEPLVPDSQVSDYSDDYDSNSDSERRVRARCDDTGAVLTTVRASVVNRLTSFRTSESQDDDTQTAGPMALHTTTASISMFKIPSLLRRTTTNLSTTSNSSTGANTPVTNEGGVRRGGSNKSNIHFQAREAERMKKIEVAEGRRREGIRKRVAGKGRVSVLGQSLESQGSGFE